MKLFSERKGLKRASEVIQIGSINETLKNSLWNVLHVELWSTPGFMSNPYRGKSRVKSFSESLWFLHFKKPIDTVPILSNDILAKIRKYFFSCAWNEVYDFLQFVVLEFNKSDARLTGALNHVLERELSGYRFVAGQLSDITSQQELDMLDETISDTRFSGVSVHMQRALELYANREKPDYRNSIKESISAVESMVREVSGEEKATLGVALKTIEKHGRLHVALKGGFEKLYGYTSDEHGIRHAMLEEPNITAADARFFLVSCSAFVNYLKAQMR